MVTWPNVKVGSFDNNTIAYTINAKKNRIQFVRAAIVDFWKWQLHMNLQRTSIVTTSQWDHADFVVKFNKSDLAQPKIVCHGLDGMCFQRFPTRCCQVTETPWLRCTRCRTVFFPCVHILRRHFPSRSCSILSPQSRRPTAVAKPRYPVSNYIENLRILRVHRQGASHRRIAFDSSFYAPNGLKICSSNVHIASN